MKYQIKQPLYGRDIVRISVEDGDSIIQEVECHKDNVYGEARWSIYLKVKDEKQALRNKFNKIYEHNSTSDLGTESLFEEKSMEKIVEFVWLVLEISPILVSAFSKVMKLINFDLSKILLRDKIFTLAKNEKHQEAIDLALESDRKGDANILTLLTNYYQEKNDLKNYIQALKSLPSDHGDYKKANSIIHDHLQTMTVPDNDNDRIDLLEEKFIYASYAGLTHEATQYFHQLCGYKDLSPIIDPVTPDVKSQIKMAKQIREMGNQIVAKDKKLLEMEKEIMELKKQLKISAPEKKKKEYRFFTGSLTNESGELHPPTSDNSFEN